MSRADSHDFWVVIHGPRAEEWKLIAGTDRFPVQSPTPIFGFLPGYEGEQRLYMLALDVMEPEVLRRIVERLAVKFGMTAAAAETELRTMGIPILADDCSVMILHPQKWLWR